LYGKTFLIAKYRRLHILLIFSNANRILSSKICLSIMWNACCDIFQCHISKHGFQFCGQWNEYSISNVSKLEKKNANNNQNKIVDLNYFDSFNYKFIAITKVNVFKGYMNTIELTKFEFCNLLLYKRMEEKQFSNGYFLYKF